MLDLLNRLVVLYGTRLPYHAGKGRLIELLVDDLGLARRYRGRRFDVERGGLRWHLSFDCLVQRCIYYNGVYAPRVLEWFRTQVRPGFTFLDVGANVGYFSLVAMQLTEGTADVHAFEPLLENFRTLELHRKRNAFPSLRTYRLALSDEEGEGLLSVPPAENSGIGSLVPDGGSTNGVQIERVPMMPLDTLVAREGIAKVDLIKIDVEGAELKVLGGARATIERDRPALLVEFNADALPGFGASTQDLFDVIDSFGYDIYKIGRRGLTRIEHARDTRGFFDAACIRRERR